MNKVVESRELVIKYVKVIAGTSKEVNSPKTNGSEL